MIAAMNTPTFPPTGDFTFTDDLRGSAVIQEDLASECFVLRDESATHVVISTPVLSQYQLASVSDNLPTLMQSAGTGAPPGCPSADHVLRVPCAGEQHR